MASGLLRRAPGFRRLLAADTLSPLGDAMGTVALILHLQQTRGTGSAVATVLVAESLPPLLSPWLGAVADRHAGRPVLVACALAQGAVVAVIAATLPDLVPLFALVLVRAAFATVAAAASGAAVPSLVADDDLPAANALLGAGRELGSVVGPAAAGLLFAATGGARAVLAVDAATFLLVVPLLAAVRLAPPVAPAREARLSIDALDGLRALWRTPVLRALALAFWIAVLAAGADDLVLPFLAVDELGAGPVAVGVLLGAASVGLLVGLAAIARIRVPWAPLTAVLVGLGVAAGSNLLTGFAPVLAAAVLTQIGRGAGIALVEANVRTLVQRTAPRAVLGRVLANLYGGVAIAAALSYAVAGPLLDATNPRLMFVLLGGLGLLAVAVGAWLARAAERDEGAPEGPLGSAGARSS